MHAPLSSTARLSLSPDGAIEGYASLFGEVDQARDMVMPGAFTQTLRQRGVRRVPMLFQHDPAEPVGIWLELREDFRGLYARGRLIPDVARGRELLALLRNGAIDGLSIGYRTVRGRIDPRTRIRSLHQVDLGNLDRDVSAARRRAGARGEGGAGIAGAPRGGPIVDEFGPRFGRRRGCTGIAHPARLRDGIVAQPRWPQGGAARRVAFERGSLSDGLATSALAAAQQARWLRPDAHRWVRPDAAKFLKPGTDPADVYPALARQRDLERQAQDRAFADALDCERAVLDALRAELADIDAELKREALRTKADRAFNRVVTALHTLKYSPSQPRVPAGNGRESGRLSDASYGNGDRPRVVIDTTNLGDDTTGDVGTGDNSYDGADGNPGFDCFEAHGKTVEH